MNKIIFDNVDGNVNENPNNKDYRIYSFENMLYNNSKKTLHIECKINNINMLIVIPMSKENANNYIVSLYEGTLNKNFKNLKGFIKPLNYVKENYYFEENYFKEARLLNDKLFNLQKYNF